MDYLQALVLSIVEGITEFLPISSTGHLILTATILKVQQTEFVKNFEIIIQLGSICAVIFLYWKTLLINIDIWKRIIIAFIPTAFVGLLLYKEIKNVLLGNPIVTAAALFIGGVLIILFEYVYKEQEHHISSISHMKYRNAFLIGLFQSISVVPGVSRSAATIIGALFLGTKRKTAVEFSFLLAVPTIAAATALDIVKSSWSLTSSEYSVLAVGFIGSFVVALLTIQFFLKFIQHNTFIPFGIYRIVISVLFWFILLK